MGERDRIARFFTPLASREPGSFDLTDDAAILTPPPGQRLVITTDSVIETVHVLAAATPQQCAQKLMRRNLSDLAAMGATPWRYTLNLHTPTTTDDAWFAAFAGTLAAEQQRFGLTLIGGDTTSGGDRIHVTMTCFGLLEGEALRRNGAQVGNDLYVSGSLGGAAYALSWLQQNMPVSEALAARYHCPEPRLQLGKMLQHVATSAIDISDGLLADIAQVCRASHVAATIHRAVIPLQHELQHEVQQNPEAWRFALSGGDDYELCFTAAKNAREAVASLAAKIELPLTRIGEITAGNGVILLDENGAQLPITQGGWEY